MRTRAEKHFEDRDANAGLMKEVEQLEARVAAQDATIAELRMALKIIQSCDGAPDPAGALHVVIRLARQALSGEASQ
jgi:hypothetical protein